MTLAKRVVACLDVDAGRVVKGVNFQALRDIGDPVELAQTYEAQGADEVVFLDIGASHEGRALTLEMVQKTAQRLFVPLTVGGGIRTPNDVRDALRAGADKVAMNTAALDNPDLISQCAQRFGAQCVVVAVDAKRMPDGTWHCFSHGGRVDTGRDAVAWCEEAARRGAGEILLTSMDGDGTRDGYDNELNRAVSSKVSIPIVASGGCGTIQHIADALVQGQADAALAASLFHDGDATVADVKRELARQAIEVRP